MSHAGAKPGIVSKGVHIPNGIRTRVAALKGLYTTTCGTFLKRFQPPRGPRATEDRAKSAVALLWNPLTPAEARRGGEGQARSGGARTPAFAPGTGVRRAKMTVQWTVIPSNGLATDGEPRAFERRGESGSEESALPGPPETTEACRGPAVFCGRWRRRRWLWELWPKPKFLVCRDETRLI